MAGGSSMARQRETATVAVMAAGFGLVGIDRFLITTMFPTIARDLHLNYADIGAITGALAIAWGLAALFMGNLSDRIGRRRVLVGSLILFSLLIGASGLATALGGLILVRIVMGIADGAYTPASITATLEASPPERHGLNIGIQQMMLPLCGLGLGPLAVGALLHVINWRYIFLIFVLPGLAVAYAVSRTVADPVRGPPASPAIDGPGMNPTRGFLHDWRAALSERNIRIAAGMMLCWLTCLMSTSAFLPNYLTDYLKLPLGQMSSVMSAIGLGSTVGTLLWPWLSDRLGRRPIMVLCTLGALGSLAWLHHAGAGMLSLFLPLFSVHFFNNALITLTVGPLCAESVPAGLAATASGLVIAIAEFFGGGLAPWLVGHAAQRFGIENFLILPMAAMVVGVLLSASIRETRSAFNPAAS
ncbi:MAG: MFS transporter [Proteobacteria bacterium]|nr:MFS transporter [Pseudomonadota bacterium]